MIEQAGSPIELYARPRNQFVAGFLGAPQMNFLPGTWPAGHGLTVALDGGRATLAAAAAQPAPQRRHRGDRSASAPSTSRSPPTARSPPPSKQTEILGAETIVHARLASGPPIMVSLRGIVQLKSGETVRRSTDETAVHLFDLQGMALAAAPTE